MKRLTAEDAETKTPDVVAENIEQLKTIFPEAFTEEKVDFEVLKQLLGGVVEEGEEKYGLNWHGKRRARQLALTPSTGTLRPCPEESVDWDTTKNLMIEGDNLEVLKLLQKSYSGKVKLIYIDPPYNTGKDFVYPDDFRDNIKNYLELTGQTDGEGRKISSNTETSGRFHTDWLNMMYPRLKLARNLLNREGVMFISIDDSEIDNLRKLCDEIFGEENFIASLVWERGRKNDARRFSVGHEYIVGYAKDLAQIEEVLSPWREPKDGVEEIVLEYHRLKTIHGEDFSAISDGLVNFYQSLPDDNPAKRYSRSRFVDKRGIWRDNNIAWPGGGGPKYDLVHPVTGIPCKIPEDGWRFVQQTMNEKVRDGYIEFREDHTKSPFLKSYLYIDGSHSNSEEDSPGEKLQVMGSVFYRHSQPSSDVMKSLFGDKIFENPKDHMILARLIRYCAGSSDIILDFFAGSGTTAHSVIELNQSDSGNRKFILCQLPEPLDSEKKEQKPAADFCDQLHRPRTIAELTKERLRRAGKKIREENPMFAGDLGFRVFKLASSNIRAWEPNRDDLPTTLHDSIEHLKTDRTEQDILFELLLKLGLDLTIPIEQKSIAGNAVHNIGAGTLLVCLAEKIVAAEVEPLALGMAAWHKALAPEGETTVVFRDSAFANDVAKTNLTAILQQHGLENVRSL